MRNAMGPWRLESDAYVVEEDRKRVRLLLAGAASSSPLADRVLALKIAMSALAPVATLASARHFRRVRKQVFPKIHAGFAQFPDAELRAVTIMNSAWVVPADDLDGFPAERLISQFRNHLSRSGFLASHEPFFGFVHGEYEASANVFVLHVHGITTARGMTYIRQLRGRWGYSPTATGAAPIRADAIGNRGRQFSYIFKLFWPMKAVRQTEQGPKRDRKPHRILEPYHSTVLRWLDRHVVGDLMIAVNVWSRRAGGSMTMRELILMIDQLSSAERNDPTLAACNALLDAFDRQIASIGGGRGGVVSRNAASPAVMRLRPEPGRHSRPGKMVKMVKKPALRGRKNGR